MKAVTVILGGLAMLTSDCLASNGPYLFVDEYLISESSGLTRTVHQPTKLLEPVLDSKTFGVTQPFVTVLRDPDTKLLKMWYCKGTEVWCAASKHGVRWSDAKCAYARKRGYGASVIDDKERDPAPNRRYKLASWESTRELDDTPQDDSGMYIQFSRDNLRWTPVPKNPVLSSWPDGYGKVTTHGVSDIIDAFWDPIHKRYAAAVKLFAGPDDPWSRATRVGDVFTRRIVGMTFSSDFVKWEEPWRILVPDDRDQGDMEFYAMGGVHARGDLLIGFVRVLRDDLPCDEGGPADGIGYTVLAWSRDGRTWMRDREPFIDRNHERGTWDHAFAWGSSSIQIGNELLIYYGGYARGHKIEPLTERQIGLARMPVDRYVSRDAGPEGGRLLTSPVKLHGRALAVNADVQGELRVRILGENGAPVAGYGWRDCRTIRGDSLVHRVGWSGRLSGLPEGVVRLEFSMKDAKLYGFDVVGDGSANSAAQSPQNNEDAAIDIGSRLELFVDDYLIDRIDGAVLKLNQPVPRESVFRFDAPWEGDQSTYVTVFNDGDR